MEGHDVGLAAYYSNDLQRRTAFLTSICVKPEFRGSGLAEVLLENVIQGAMNNEMENLSLEVDAKNQVAVRFYSKHGFNECGNNQMVRYIAKEGSLGTAPGENRAGKSSRHS
jgi:ribosomal protein S18 acetylase RimI-like enzyme